MLHVEQGEHVRLGRARNRDGERVVDDVDVAEQRAQVSRPQRSRHPSRAAGPSVDVELG